MVRIKRIITTQDLLQRPLKADSFECNLRISQIRWSIFVPLKAYVHVHIHRFLGVAQHTRSNIHIGFYITGLRYTTIFPQRNKYVLGNC